MTDLNDFTTYAFLETIANTQTIKAKSQERSYCSSQSVEHKSFILNKENGAILLCGGFHVGVKSTADLDLKLQHWRHKRLLMCVAFFSGIFLSGNLNATPEGTVSRWVGVWRRSRAAAAAESSCAIRQEESSWLHRDPNTHIQAVADYTRHDVVTVWPTIVLLIKSERHIEN